MVINIYCLICENKIKELPKSYSCSCGLTVWKQIAGKKLSRHIIEELLKTGRTPVLNGFRSRKGKPFSAALVLADRKVTFEFDGNGYRKKGNDHKYKTSGIVNVRIESGNSGSVFIMINSPINLTTTVNYGLVPSRMAECLGSITVTRLIKHHMGNVGNKHIKLSLNNVEFSKYILRERTPRNLEIRKTVEHLWNLLGEFATWQAYYKRSKRPRLKGGPQSESFPRGIFPWLKIPLKTNDDNLYAKLPDLPDVQAQFQASIWKSKQLEDGVFVIPKSSEKALQAWINIATGGVQKL